MGDSGESGQSCESSNSDESVDSGGISGDDESHNFYKFGDSCLYGDFGDSDEFGEWKWQNWWFV